ncbi:bd6732d9-ad4d-4c4a-a94f-1677e89e25f7 [Sclerotinia trifoliorum]|uniref:Bd6732d9-ad4d-4c4a-a94f-1677e89e25f7 n=1 Tax=Sclerotinia trifoliorum TaxID=28548 RepID=A0A8H2ZTX5_9HELO|nr:bd6732d9-ad4d-4c4a-a94f-1677e89e25f7 [Sclerotinia trifoliorum]
MGTPASRVTGFTPGKLICGASDERLIFPDHSNRMDPKVEEKAPIKSSSNKYPGVFSISGQKDETDMNDGRKTPTLNDVQPLFNSAWEDTTEGSPLGMKERKTRQKLNERDHNAVEYSKSLLDEGDTQVYISYPGGITFYDSKGDSLPYKVYRVDSEKLKALGSPKFSRMFEERPQYWARKRKGLLHHLPDGMRYVLDLTPSEEGDEAVELVSELSCSAGIRNWYLAEQRCGVEKQLVAGDDDIPGPAIVPAKAAEQLRVKNSAAGVVDLFFSPLDPTIDSRFNDEFFRTSLGRKVLKQTACTDGNFVDDCEMQKAIKNSLEGHAFNEPAAKASAGIVRQDFLQTELKKEVLDYSPIRHRVGIDNLLRIIQGKFPKLDSAPKVWTLFVLAKYYECTSVVVDYITSWIMNGSNIKFLEILPEASLNLGLGLKIPMITRAAFSILVSEEALNVASRTLCKSHDDRRAADKYVRPREELDEDLWNVIQHASQDFCDRIQKIITDLLDERMAWFLELPEYRKICKFEDYCYKKKDTSKTEKAVYERRKSVIQQLLVNLRSYVRAKIVICLNQGLKSFEITRAENNQREVQWDIPEVGTKDVPDADYIYNGLGVRERVLLPYFWRRLRDVNWHDMSMESLRLALYDPQLLRSGKCLADRDTIRRINRYHLEIYVSDFNREVNLAARQENYHPSSPSDPDPTVLQPNTKSMNAERPNYAFMSAYNPDHAYLQARLVEDSSEFSFANNPKSFSANPNPSLHQPDIDAANNFDLSTFLKELGHHIEDICLYMLSKPDGSEFTILTDTLLCLTDNEWQYLPLWAGGNDDGSGGVTSADVPPAYYANVGSLTPGVQYKGVAGFVGSVNTSLVVRDGSNRTATIPGSEAWGEAWGDVGSDGGSGVGIATDGDVRSVSSIESYDMAVMMPVGSCGGSGSESEFEIVNVGEDEESGDDFTFAGNSSVSESGISDDEIVHHDKGKGKWKEKDYEEDDMAWKDQEDLDDDWEGYFTDD